MSRRFLPFLMTAGLLAAAGCGDNEGDSASSAAQSTTSDALRPPPGHPGGSAVPVHGSPSARTDAAPLTGTVTETMDATRYTYVRLDTTRGDVWAAAPQFEVSEGDRVELRGYSMMRGFHSSTLDRTFDEILFVQDARVAGAGGEVAAPAAAAQMPPGHPPVGGGMPPGHPSTDDTMPAGHPAVGQPSGATSD